MKQFICYYYNIGNPKIANLQFLTTLEILILFSRYNLVVLALLNCSKKQIILSSSQLALLIALYLLIKRDSSECMHTIVNNRA